MFPPAMQVGGKEVHRVPWGIVSHSISEVRWGNILKQIGSGYHNTPARRVGKGSGSHLTDNRTQTPRVKGHVCCPLENKGPYSSFFFFFLWWILSYIKMKQPWVYMCSPSRSSLPPPSPPTPSRFSQCTRSERLSHASNPGW